MNTQPTFFGHANTRTRQPRMFDDAGPAESNLSCECGEPLTRTPSGFLCCPLGHGKLMEAANDPRRWDGDDADLFTDEGE